MNPELAAAAESDALVEEASEDDNVVDGDVDDGSNVASSEPSKTTKVAKSAPVNVKPRARKIAKRRKKRVSHSVTTSGAEEEEDSDTVPLQPLSKASETLIRPVTPAVSTHRPSSTVSGGSSGRLSAVLSKLFSAITSRISAKSPKPVRQFQPLVIDAPAVTTAPSPVHIRVESPRTLASTPNGVTSASNVPMLPPIRRLGSRLASHAPSLSSSPPSHHSSSSSRHPPDVLAAWKAERGHLLLLADRLRASIASRHSQKHPIAVGLGTGVGPVLGLTPWELRLLLSSADADTLAAYRDVILQECSDRGVRMMQVRARACVCLCVPSASSRYSSHMMARAINILMHFIFAHMISFALYEA